MPRTPDLACLEGDIISRLRTLLPKRTKAPGKLIGGGWAVEAFTDQGFAWGGRFGSLKDYMHFEFG